MDLQKFLTLLQVAVSLGLIIVVQLQSRGSSMGTVFGGGGGDTFKSRRGLEAVLFNLTILFGIIFTVNAIAIAVLNVRLV